MFLHYAAGLSFFGFFKKWQKTQCAQLHKRARELEGAVTNNFTYVWPGWPATVERSRAFASVSFLFSFLGLAADVVIVYSPLVIIIIEACECDIHLETCFFLFYSSSL